MWENEWELMAKSFDSRGRILIPKDIREAHNIGPGSPVIIESTPEGILLRPALSKEEALERLIGAINGETRRQDAEPMDPVQVKAIWEPDV